jgi:hypothetical protein
MDLKKLKKELGKILNQELIEKVISNSKVKKNRNGGLTIRVKKKK